MWRIHLPNRNVELEISNRVGIFIKSLTDPSTSLEETGRISHGFTPPTLRAIIPISFVLIAIRPGPSGSPKSPGHALKRLSICESVARRRNTECSSSSSPREKKRRKQPGEDGAGGTKFIVRQTTRTSQRRKYPGAEEFVTPCSFSFFLGVRRALVSRDFKP